MNLQQLTVKIYAERTGDFSQDDLIPVFHRWIQEKQVPHRLLIDVADYRHVPDGPGVMLIAHECHYGLDEGRGRLGLLYARKRDEAGPAAERLEEAFRDALAACSSLEADPALAGKIRFPGNEVRIEVRSRLVAANTPEDFEALRPELDAFLDRLYGDAPRELSREEDPRAPLAVEVVTEVAPGAKALLERLG